MDHQSLDPVSCDFLFSQDEQQDDLTDQNSENRLAVLKWKKEKGIPNKKLLRNNENLTEMTWTSDVIASKCCFFMWNSTLVDWMSQTLCLCDELPETSLIQKPSRPRSHWASWPHAAWSGVTRTDPSGMRWYPVASKMVIPHMMPKFVIVETIKIQWIRKFWKKALLNVFGIWAPPGCGDESMISNIWNLGVGNSKRIKKAALPLRSLCIESAITSAYLSYLHSFSWGIPGKSQLSQPWSWPI